MPSQPVDIVETDEFKGKCGNYLGDVELDAIRHLLAAKPWLGEPISDLPGLLRIGWRRDVHIIYMVSATTELLTIYLIAIGSNSPSPDGEGRKQINSLLDTLKKIGIGIGVREIIKELWELIKENLP